MDTQVDFNAEGVNPQVIENYDGGLIELGNSGFKLDPADFKSLENIQAKHSSQQMEQPYWELMTSQVLLKL